MTKPSKILSDTPQENTQLPIYRNGRVCSAHELIVADYKSIKGELKDINTKLNALLIAEGIDEAIEEKEEKESEKKQDKHARWVDMGIGSGLTFMGLIAFELIKYFTVL